MFKLFKLFTTYSFGSAIFSKIYKQIPESILEFIRSLVLIVAIAVIYIYLVYGVNAIKNVYGNQFPLWLLFIFDFIVHVGPVILLGLPNPRNIAIIIAGYITFLAWYLLVRKQIQNLYISYLTTGEYDLLITIIVPIILTIYVSIYMI